MRSRRLFLRVGVVPVRQKFTICAAQTCLGPSWHLSRQPPSSPASQFTFWTSRLGGPAAILFISHDTSSNSIAKCSCLFLWGIAQLLGPKAPRVAAVKKLNLVHRGKCRGFFVKFLAAIFPGNWRTKICTKICQNFAAFFADLFEKFRKNFALGDCGHKQLSRYTLLYVAKWGIARMCLCKIKYQGGYRTILGSAHLP